MIKLILTVQYWVVPLAVVIFAAGCSDEVPGDEWDVGESDAAAQGDVSERGEDSEEDQDANSDIEQGDAPRSCDAAAEGTLCQVQGVELTSRCSVGKWRCDANGEEMVCEQLLRPMPETCNGLDDNCNGLIDDLSLDWDDDEFAHLDAPEDYDGASCFGGDDSGVSCTCPGPSDDLRLDHHVGRGDTTQEEFDAYVEEHVGGPAGCYCMAL